MFGDTGPVGRAGVINAAGILFLAPGKRALFLKRSGGAGHDHAGEWCFPGGCAEDDETPEQTARREAKEEIGKHPNLKLRLHTRSISNNSLPVGNSQPAAAGVPSLVAAAEAGAGASLNPANDAAPAAVSQVDPISRGPTDPTAAPPDSMVDFSTFLMDVDRPFLVDELSDEHVAWAWAPIDAPPDPLHPGCRIALDRLTMDELGVADAMSLGRLTSPQVYENITLLDIRITGTETAYRKALDEYVYRRPENYLNHEFLRRCAGLSVIMEHPRGAVLNSKEYNDRIVGSVFVPYIKGDEVWAIAKIYDVDAIRLLSDRKMSTSPSVVFREPDVNQKVDLDDGSTLLIEGKPSLLDHIAICEHGVWDKGGEPTGVVREPELVRGDSVMAEAEEKEALKEEKKEEKKEGEKATDSTKADADAGTKLDRVLSCLDSMGKRMDSMEETEKKRRGDSKKADDWEDMKKKDSKKADDDDDEDEDDDKAKRLAADKKKDSKRKDAKKADEHDEKIAADKKKDSKADDDDDDDDSKKDSKKADSRADSLQRQLDELKAKVAPRADDEEAALADAQARADSAYMMAGDAAPRWLPGEPVLAYRRRLLKKHQAKSSEWKDIDLAKADSAVLEIAEKRIYADSIAANTSPGSVSEGTLRMIRKSDETGRVHVSWVGQPRAWMSQFAPPTRRIQQIRTRSRDSF
jgi:8-oxo-dGTP pyrophosphatase MutT (NUDIX family)